MKYAIVTGGTKGIGLAVSRMLLSEGYHVIATYAKDELSADMAQKELSSISSDFELVKADQSSKFDMHKFVNFLISNQISIDCIICNAGTTIRTPLEETTDEEWERVMQVNVNSNVFLIRDLKHLMTNKSRIIFIGSMMGVLPHSVSLAYGVTKSAIHALTKNLVKEFDGTETTVNAIAPGFVDTEWQKTKPIEIKNNINMKTALHRFAKVDEIADAVKFCINNSYVNGSIIEVSGGYNYK